MAMVAIQDTEKEKRNHFIVVTPKGDFRVQQAPIIQAISIHVCMCKYTGGCMDEGNDDTIVIVLPERSYHIERQRYTKL